MCSLVTILQGFCHLQLGEMYTHCDATLLFSPPPPPPSPFYISLFFSLPFLSIHISDYLFPSLSLSISLSLFLSLSLSLSLRLSLSVYSIYRKKCILQNMEFCQDEKLDGKKVKQLPDNFPIRKNERNCFSEIMIDRFISFDLSSGVYQSHHLSLSHSI